MQPAGRSAWARTVAVAAVALLGSACGAAASGTPTAAVHAEHDIRTQRIVAALGEEFGMTFQPAGPHHEVGRAPDGVELDLVGIPVEQVILSVPATDPELGHAYMPFVRDILKGPDRVYDWAASMLACRGTADASCEDRFEQGNVEARFTEGGPNYVVVSFTRGP